MNTTTIRIHGLDIEFTDKPPPRAGAYWWLHRNGSKPKVREIFNPCSDVLIDCETDWQPKDVGGLWSAPLIPVTEVEKAFFEFDKYREGYQNSRARRVVEGLE